MKAVHHKGHIIVLGRAAHHKNLSVLLSPGQNRLRHHFPHTLIVKGNVQIHIRIFNQTIIGNHPDALPLCLAYRLAQCRIVRGNNDNHIHILLNQIFDLSRLLPCFSVGTLNVDLRPKLRGSCHKSVSVPLPPLNNKGVKA